jgi:hypothetical protein
VQKTASHDAATFGAFERCMSSYRKLTEILKVHQDMRFLLIIPRDHLLKRKCYCNNNTNSKANPEADISFESQIFVLMGE